MMYHGVHRSFRSMFRALTVIPCFHLLLSPMHGVTPFSPLCHGQHIISSITGAFPPSKDDDARRIAVVVAAARAPHHHVCAGNASRRHSTGRRRASSAAALFSQPPAAAPENKEAGGKLELTPAKIAELIEVSFLQSCLQLSQGYVDVLKLFIVAVKAGYEYPLGLEELNALVETCPVNSAGRDLTDEEQALRLEWMSMVYEMVTALKDSEILDRADSDDDGSSGDDGAATLRISKVRQAMLAIQKELQREETTTGGKRDATVALNNLTVEQALARSPSLSQWNAAMLDPMEKAFLTNDIRVALMTFRVLEEEKVCTMDASGSRVTSKGSAELGDEVPRPPIPGT